MRPIPYLELLLLMALSCPAAFFGIRFYRSQKAEQNYSLNNSWLGAFIVELLLLACAAILFPQSLIWNWIPLNKLALIPLAIVVALLAELLCLYAGNKAKWRFFAAPPGKLLSSLLLINSLALLEELLYRGIVLSLLQHNFGLNFWLSLIVSSSLFALMHCYQGMRTILAKFSTGIIYALLFFLSGTLLASILAHALQNTLVLVLGYWQQQRRSKYD